MQQRTLPTRTNNLPPGAWNLIEATPLFSSWQRSALPQALCQRDRQTRMKLQDLAVQIEGLIKEQVARQTEIEQRASSTTREAIVSGLGCTADMDPLQPMFRL